MKKLMMLITFLILSACGGEEHNDLKQWMKNATQDYKGGVTPLPQIKPFPLVAYEAGGAVEPFQPSKIEPERKLGGGGLQPDLNRRKEPLESYPLESLKMVGTIKQGKLSLGLVQADKGVYQVKVGNYIGQNFGVITNITDADLTLKELVPDSLGDYTERTSTLQLQEKQEGTK